MVAGVEEEDYGPLSLTLEESLGGILDETKGTHNTPEKNKDYSNKPPTHKRLKENCTKKHKNKSKFWDPPLRMNNIKQPQRMTHVIDLIE